MEKSLEAIQDEQYEWSKANFGPQDPMLPLLGVVEEVGELCRAVLKRKQGIRMDEDHLRMEKDAIGDIVICMMDYCNRRGFSLLHLVRTAWDEVKKRNWSPFQREDGSWTYTACTQMRLFDEDKD